MSLYQVLRELQIVLVAFPCATSPSHPPGSQPPSPEPNKVLLVDD